MPDKDTKKNETPTQDVQELREKETDLGKLERVSAPSVSTGADDLTNAALNRQSKQEESTKITNAISDAYYSPIRDLTNKTSEMLAKRNAIKEQDEVAQRRGRSMQMIAGISDGLASLANLIGVGQGGTNIDMGTGSLTPLAQKLEAARQERKADIKSIDDRLEQANNQLMQMKLAKGTAIAQAKEKASEAAREQARFDIEMAFKQGRAKAADSQWQQTFDANKENAAADRSLRQTQITNDYNLRLKQLNQSAEQAGLKGSFPVLIGEDEMLDIPKNEINNATIGRIFEQLPKEFKDLAQGKPIYTYEYGEKVATGQYEQPSLDQKLAAIGAASRTDTTIQDELRKLAGTYKPAEKKDDGAQASEIDNSYLNGLGTMSIDPNFVQSKSKKVNWNQFE